MVRRARGEWSEASPGLFLCRPSQQAEGPHKPERKDVVAQPGLAAWEKGLGATGSVLGTRDARPPARAGAGPGRGLGGGMGARPRSASDPLRFVSVLQLTKSVHISDLRGSPR